MVWTLPCQPSSTVPGQRPGELMCEQVQETVRTINAVFYENKCWFAEMFVSEPEI